MSVDPATTARVLRARVRRDPWITATGTSMAPFIGEGVRLRITLETRRPRVGEVWLFVSDTGAMVVHRYLRRTRTVRLVFVGDGAPGADRPVRPDWLVGRAVEMSVGGSCRPVTRRSGIWPVLRAAARGLRRRLVGRWPVRSRSMR